MQIYGIQEKVKYSITLANHEKETKTFSTTSFVSAQHKLSVSVSIGLQLPTTLTPLCVS